MRARLAATLLSASALTILLVSSACTQPQPAESGAPTGGPLAQGPGALPDLSKATVSVQTQVRDRHSALLLTIANRHTPPGELADAYGEMGKLLMAAQYLDAAVPFFLNAQTVNAGDFRWPYYLGQ